MLFAESRPGRVGGSLANLSGFAGVAVHFDFRFVVVDAGFMHRPACRVGQRPVVVSPHSFHYAMM